MVFWQSQEKLFASSSFIVIPSDYNIKIPSVVKNKIADTVNINLKFELEKKQ